MVVKDTQVRWYVCISALVLGVLSTSVTSAQSTLYPNPEAKWLEDGWRVDFGDAHCYMGNTYTDRRNDALEIVNINFIQIANLSLAKSSYSFGLWNALDHVGVKQDELVFLVAMPGPLHWHGDQRSSYAIDVNVDELEATFFDTTDFLEDSQEQVWFFIREPLSSLLIETFSDAEPVGFDVVLNDNSRLSFEYHFKPDLDFKVNQAQFEACLRVLAP